VYCLQAFAESFMPVACILYTCKTAENNQLSFKFEMPFICIGGTAYSNLRRRLSVLEAPIIQTWDAVYLYWRHRLFKLEAPFISIRGTDYSNLRRRLSIFEAPIIQFEESFISIWGTDYSIWGAVYLYWRHRLFYKFEILKCVTLVNVYSYCS